MGTGHTPTPWQVIDRRAAPLKNIQVADALGNHVAEVHHVHQRDYLGTFDGDHKAADAFDAVGLANADRIVRAVNAHDALLAALEESIQWSPYQGESEETDFLRRARAAIAAAKG